MPKSKSQAKYIEEVSEDELSFSESEEGEQQDTQLDHNSSEESDDEQEQVQETSSKKKSKLTSHEIISQLDTIQQSLSNLSSEFKKKTVEFKAVEKQYMTEKTKLEKEQQTLFKKLGKTVSTKSKTVKKRDPTTIGGFNKKSQVPPCLCTYLDIDSDTKLSRPEVVGLLKTKFEEEGFVDNETKEIRVSNKVLKKFGIQKNYVFKGNRYQSFLKLIYDEFKEKPLSV